MSSQTAQVDDLRLVAMPSAMNCAEMFVRFTLSEWSLRPLSEDAARVVRGSVSAIVDGSDTSAPAFITVRLRVSGDYLVAEVFDDRAIRPADAHELPLPAGVTASGVPLPRRGQRRSLVEEQLGSGAEQAEIDPQLVRRVLTGLTRSTEL